MALSSLNANNYYQDCSTSFIVTQYSPCNQQDLLEHYAKTTKTLTSLKKEYLEVNKNVAIAFIGIKTLISSAQICSDDSCDYLEIGKNLLKIDLKHWIDVLTETELSVMYQEFFLSELKEAFKQQPIRETVVVLRLETAEIEKIVAKCMNKIHPFYYILALTFALEGLRSPNTLAMQKCCEKLLFIDILPKLLVSDQAEDIQKIIGKIFGVVTTLEKYNPGVKVYFYLCHFFITANRPRAIISNEMVHPICTVDEPINEIKSVDTLLKDLAAFSESLAFHFIIKILNYCKPPYGELFYFACEICHKLESKNQLHEITSSDTFAQFVDILFKSKLMKAEQMTGVIQLASPNMSEEKKKEYSELLNKKTMEEIEAIESAIKAGKSLTVSKDKQGAVLNLLLSKAADTLEKDVIEDILIHFIPKIEFSIFISALKKKYTNLDFYNFSKKLVDRGIEEKNFNYIIQTIFLSLQFHFSDKDSFDALDNYNKSVENNIIEYICHKIDSLPLTDIEICSICCDIFSTPTVSPFFNKKNSKLHLLKWLLNILTTNLNQYGDLHSKITDFIYTTSCKELKNSFEFFQSLEDMHLENGTSLFENIYIALEKQAKFQKVESSKQLKELSELCYSPFRNLLAQYKLNSNLLSHKKRVEWLKQWIDIGIKLKKLPCDQVIVDLKGSQNIENYSLKNKISFEVLNYMLSKISDIPINSNDNKIIINFLNHPTVFDKNFKTTESIIALLTWLIKNKTHAVGYSAPQQTIQLFKAQISHILESVDVDGAKKFIHLTNNNELRILLISIISKRQKNQNDNSSHIVKGLLKCIESKPPIMDIREAQDSFFKLMFHHQDLFNADQWGSLGARYFINAIFMHIFNQKMSESDLAMMIGRVKEEIDIFFDKNVKLDVSYKNALSIHLVVHLHSLAINPPLLSYHAQVCHLSALFYVLTKINFDLNVPDKIFAIIQFCFFWDSLKPLDPKILPTLTLRRLYLLKHLEQEQKRIKGFRIDLVRMHAYRIVASAGIFDELGEDENVRKKAREAIKIIWNLDRKVSEEWKSQALQNYEDNAKANKNKTGSFALYKAIPLPTIFDPQPATISLMNEFFIKGPPIAFTAIQPRI